MMMVPTKLLPLLTTRPAQLEHEDAHGPGTTARAAPEAGDESVAEFVEEHYGAEAVDYLAEPLLSGVYGGDPSALSVGAVLPRFVELANRYGSLTRGVLAERAKAASHRSHGPKPPLFRTLKGGLGQMVDAVTESIRGKVEVASARRDSGTRRRGFSRAGQRRLARGKPPDSRMRSA